MVQESLDENFSKVKTTEKDKKRLIEEKPSRKVSKKIEKKSLKIEQNLFQGSFFTIMTLLIWIFFLLILY